MVFYVDGEQKGTFVREAPGSPGYIYNHTVFAASSLEDGEHKLLIQNGHQGGKKVLTLLDRIVYTQNRKAEASTTSTPQPTGDGKEQGIQGTQTEAGQDDGDDTMKLGAILGGVLGGLGFFLIIGFGWLFWRLRNRSNQNVWKQWPSGIAGDSVHPVDPPVYNEISDEGSVGRSFTNATMTPFMGEAPTAGTWPSSRKGLARGHVLQLSSTGS
ncbi:hypothetical protein Agabi119p4_8585 [Agaricus bisporus var. burnettii]|uniref:Transmembrane protein n=1 Tax=Agaricus bisporus var. burnettii TaxID=192524 RepID=A0A8H7C892_AGABI|nr:hypothetical protein Agabi119p4_8585 [Agaricus bisporus var. burnettii]